MSRHRLYHYDPKLVRDKIRSARVLAESILRQEQELIMLLSEFDEHRYFVRVGYRSLRRFCNHGLKFTRTQAQRLVTAVRRRPTTVDIEHQQGATCEHLGRLCHSDLLDLPPSDLSKTLPVGYRTVCDP